MNIRKQCVECGVTFDRHVALVLPEDLNPDACDACQGIAYTGWNSDSGWCGHDHATENEAKFCVDAHARTLMTGVRRESALLDSVRKVYRVRKGTRCQPNQATPPGRLVEYRYASWEDAVDLKPPF